MNQIEEINQAGENLSHRQVKHITNSLGPLQGLYPKSHQEAQETGLTLAQIAKPAKAKWIAQRVVTLLTHYFIAEAHPAALSQIAEDWIAELSECPEWAIDAACKWWIGSKNDKRGRKPLPGDISARTLMIMAPIFSGKAMLSAFEKHGNNPPPYLKKA